MNIAILGTTSQIAQDLVLYSSEDENNYQFSLFGRNVESLNDPHQMQPYSDFNNNQNYDVIINFVGAGNPVKIQEMGEDIIGITEQYDNMALDYIKYHKQTKYIFLSSGAVYGGNYQELVGENTVATIDVNNLKSTDWYTLAKLYAEAKHRSLSDMSIVDVRVFNYFSHTQDMSARFLMTDVIRAIKNQEVLKTFPDNIVRDFITPPDFYNFIQSIINSNPINMALDCYTKEPIAKFDLLAELESKFGLRYEIDQTADIVDATGTKMNYYSTNRLAGSIGYNPERTSKDGIIQEIDKYLKNYA